VVSVTGFVDLLHLCVQVAFVEMPNFNFDLTLYGGDIGFLPGLEAWITTVIKDSVLRSACLSAQMYHGTGQVAQCCAGVCVWQCSSSGVVLIFGMHDIVRSNASC